MSWCHWSWRGRRWHLLRGCEGPFGLRGPIGFGVPVGLEGRVNVAGQGQGKAHLIAWEVERVQQLLPLFVPPMGGHGHLQQGTRLEQGQGTPLLPVAAAAGTGRRHQARIGPPDLPWGEHGLLQQELHLQPLLLRADGCWHGPRHRQAHKQKVRASAACGRCAWPSNMSRSDLCARQP